MRLMRAIIAGVVGATVVAGATAAEPPVAYRRVYVPAEKPSVWPRGDRTYLPVEKRDFENWVAIANAAPAAATITESRYKARLAAGELKGSGTWHVETTGKGLARIELSDVSIALKHARWRDDASRPVRLGWWPVDGSEKLQRALEVSQSGDLEFEWRLPAAFAMSSTEFSLLFADAARTQFELDLPAGRQPLFTRGVILQSPGDRNQGGRWVVALPPGGPHTLRIKDSASTTNPSAASTKVHQHLAYHLSQSGLELRAQLRFDAGNTSLQQLRIVLPRNFRLLEASCGERQLKWRIADDRVGDAPLEAIVEFGREPLGHGKSVSLLCWGPPVVGEPLSLPMLSVADAFWTSGTIDIAIDEALAPSEPTPVDCVQTAVDEVTTDRGPAQQLSFTAFDPAASVEFVLNERPARGNVSMGTTLDVGNPRVTARTVVDVSVEQRNLRRLSATLMPGWSVEAVETVPADALGEWYVDRSSEAHVLDLQLHQAVTPDRPVQVILSGRFERAGSGEPLSIGKLNPLEWNDLSTKRTLLQLRAAEQFELEVAADLQYVAVPTVSATERALFVDPDAAPICDLAASPPAAVIRLVPKKGAYDATIQIDVALQENRLQRSYRVECRPRGGGVDHVFVFLSQPALRPLEWFESDSETRLSAERMPENDPRLGGLPHGGELWLVDLGRLYVRPFTLAAHTIEPWPRRDRVTLAALPDAASQQGRVAISSMAVELPTIIAQGMSPTSLPFDDSVESSNGATAVRAVYRYQPARFYDASPAAQLWVGPASSSTADAELIATHVDLASRYAIDGSGVHHASYRLQNLGRKEMQLTLPTGVELEAVRVDGDPQSLTSQDALTLALPQRSDFSLELELSSRQSPLASGHRLESPLPNERLTIVAGSWRVSLPHGFETSGDFAPDAQLNWRQRWFGPLARRQDDRPFNPFDARDWNGTWAELSRAVSTPAIAEAPDSKEERAMPTGWHTVDIDFVAGSPAAITLAHRPATLAIGLAVFLACAMIPRVAQLRGLAVFLLALFAGALSVLVPALYAPLGAAATLGFGAAALWQGWQRMSLRRLPALVAAVLILTWAPIALAAEPSAAIESVLIPVDGAGQPSGSRSFVSSQFLRTLMQGNATAAGAPWLISETRCDGELVPELEPHLGLRPADWKLTIEIEAFGRDVAVRLPLRKDEANWSATAFVDGMPTPLAWDAAGRECTIHITEPGQKLVALPLVPQVVTSSGRQTVTIKLPKIRGAAVSIAAPASVAEVRGDERPYQRQAASDRVMWHSELNPSGRFVATWKVPAADSATAGDLGLEQFSHLQIEPDSLLLTTTLRRQEQREWPETIELAVDEHWACLADRSAATIDDSERLPDGRKLLRVRLEVGNRNQREIVLHFRSSRESSLGRIPLPSLQLVSPKTDSHVLAVTCDKALDCVPSFTPPAGLAPPTEFSTTSPVGTPAPQIMLEASKIKPDWYLTVRSRELVSSYEDRLALAASKRRLRVDYRCDVDPLAADRFGWSLAVPKLLSVERVTVASGDELIPIDWTRPTPTLLVVHFSRAATQPYQVELMGIMPLAPGGRTAVPQIAPLRLKRKDQVAHLYRDENTLAYWEPARATTPAELPANQSSPFAESVRLVGTQRITAESAPTSFLLVEENRPIVRGDTLTVVSRHDDTWTATFHMDLRVDRGVIGVLRLRLPTNWVGPFHVTPAASALVTSDAGNRTLDLRLPQAVSAGQSIRLSVDSPLKVADGEVPVAPRIQLAHVGERQEFLAVPAIIGGQQATWTKRGVEPAELPRSLREQGAVPAGTEALLVTADFVNVALRPRATRASAANIRLADTAVRVAAGGGQVSVTRFVIAPEGLSHCTVKLPDGDELVRLQLDGHAALARSLDPRSWQVQLGPPELPQVLEVVTRSAMPTAGAARVVSLARPNLENAGETIPIEFSLWTLRHAGQVGNPRVTVGSLVTPAELAAARFDQLMNISHSATRSVIELPLVDGYHWFARWSGRLEAAARSAGLFERQSADDSGAIRVPQPDEPLAETEARYEAWLDQINEIFAAAEWNSAAAAREVAPAFDPWSGLEADSDNQVCFISDGNECQALVEFIPPGMTPNASRIALLVALAAVGMAAVWVARRPKAVETIEQWPEAVGLTLGIVAWAWLRPSVLGLLLVAMCMALLARRMIRARKSPRHDSFNQPSENAERLA